MSEQLTELLNRLSAQQRRAIQMILQAEADNQPITTLLKTAYSCQYCGHVIGRPTTPRDDRKALLAHHEAECDKAPVRWQFAVNHSTFYHKWSREKLFTDALDLARATVTSQALANARRILQAGTPEAAAELLRQIRKGEKDSDRRGAAVALLDRADVTTAGKGLDPVKNWLDALRGVDDDAPD